jgi:hypothetical protein
LAQRSRSSPRESARPVFNTTIARPTSPHFASGIPVTAASATASVEQEEHSDRGQILWIILKGHARADPECIGRIEMGARTSCVRQQYEGNGLGWGLTCNYGRDVMSRGMLAANIAGNRVWEDNDYSYCVRKLPALMQLSELP